MRVPADGTLLSQFSGKVLLLTRTMLLWKFLAKCKNVIWHYQFTAFLYDILFQHTFPNYTYMNSLDRLDFWLLKTNKKSQQFISLKFEKFLISVTSISKKQSKKSDSKKNEISELLWLFSKYKICNIPISTEKEDRGVNWLLQ